MNKQILGLVLFGLTLLLPTIGSASVSFEDFAGGRELMEIHSLSCTGSVSGWWLTLDGGGPSTQSVSGGVSTADGNFFGCGSCGECRNKLKQLAQDTLNHYKTGCESRGGKITSSSLGTMRDAIQPTSWSFYQEGITSVCKKWIPC